MNEEQILPNGLDGPFAVTVKGLQALRSSGDDGGEGKTGLLDQIRAETQSDAEDVLRRKPNKNTPFEELKTYITAKVKYTYQVFMARQTRITEKHMARLQPYMMSVFDDLLKSGVLRRANVVCDWRVNTQASIADNDLVCFVIYETPSGSVVGVTACQNPIHARVDALQAAKQMPGIRRI